MGRGQDLYKKAKKIIPGGTQLLSKRPEMFLPDFWPAYYSKAKGCKVWDLDGKKYTDMSYMGIGANILGYANEKVNQAVKKAIEQSNMCTLNAPEEVELAQLLINLHPWAQMARFARSGGEAMAIAVRIARAATGKDKVLFCGYHGWHDWYLAANLADNKALDGQLLPGLEPKGVPRGLRGTAIPFIYNDTECFLKLIKKYSDEVGVVVMEPIRNFKPNKDFISAIRSETRKRKIVLIVDEVTAGWRLNLGGAHLTLGIEPDIAVFGKGMSNGYPMGAIIGKAKIMNKAQESFISSTYWTERIGPVAALATIKEFKRLSVQKKLITTGKMVQEGWARLAKKHSLEIKVEGIYPLGHFTFISKEPLVLKTLFTQEMLKKGFLASTAFYASYAHNKSDVKRYLQATDEVFEKIAKAQKSDPKKYLDGEICHSGFARLA
ncbi:MAG: aminotransferase class III-fold pyridoxal phosphate-dependent enzyme [Candidatus Berkelbacteria bacterium]|nr:aminotransferase class III-fold pyridoxal phosphate-dependent enzyme [Candidatus Berkelbacteria bacterium]